MSSDAAVRVRRAMIVDEWGACSWDEYLRETSAADDGRDPARWRAE